MDLICHGCFFKLYLMLLGSSPIGDNDLWFLHIPGMLHSVCLSRTPLPWGLSAGSKALPTGSRALLACAETLPAGSENLLAGLRGRPAGNAALLPNSKALQASSYHQAGSEPEPAGSEPLPALVCAIGHRPLWGRCPITTNLTVIQL